MILKFQKAKRRSPLGGLRNEGEVRSFDIPHFNLDTGEFIEKFKEKEFGKEKDLWVLIFHDFNK